MAIYRTGVLAGAISGAVGGAVFVNAPGSKVVRRAPVTKRKRTSPLGLIMTRPQSALATARTGWAELTEINRDAWNAKASQISFPNRLGQYRPISGYHLYMKVNVQRTIRLVTPMTTGPGVTRPQGIAELTVVASVASGLDVTIDSPLDPTARLAIVYGAISWSSTPPKFFRDYRYLGTANFTKAATLELIALWEPRYGDLRLGQHISLKLKPWIIDTWTGAPITQTTTVVA